MVGCKPLEEWFNQGNVSLGHINYCPLSLNPFKYQSFRTLSHVFHYVVCEKNFETKGLSLDKNFAAIQM